MQRLREAGATHLAIAPCVIGPETDPAEFTALSAALNAPCAAPLGGHPAIAQLVAVRYGEALARIAEDEARHAETYARFLQATALQAHERTKT